MKALIGCCWLALGAASVLSAQTAPPASSLTGFGEVMEVDVVNVEVYVAGRDGKRVTDLKREDFAVFEDGKPVEVTNFAAFSSSGAMAAPTPPGPLRKLRAPPPPYRPHRPIPRMLYRWWCSSTTCTCVPSTAPRPWSRSAPSLLTASGRATG